MSHFYDLTILLFRFNIKVGPQNAKGINLRKGILTKPEEFAVTIQPVFANELECGKKNDISILLEFQLICRHIYSCKE